jgi:hypothetical protein
MAMTLVMPQPESIVLVRPHGMTIMPDERIVVKLMDVGFSRYRGVDGPGGLGETPSSMMVRQGMAAFRGYLSSFVTNLIRLLFVSDLRGTRANSQRCVQRAG